MGISQNAYKNHLLVFLKHISGWLSFNAQTLIRPNPRNERNLGNLAPNAWNYSWINNGTYEGEFICVSFFIWFYGLYGLYMLIYMELLYRQWINGFMSVMFIWRFMSGVCLFKVWMDSLDITRVWIYMKCFSWDCEWEDSDLLGCMMYVWI